MKKLITLSLVAVTALGLSACTQKTTNENVTINDTSANLEAPAADANLIDNASDATLENGTNAL